MNEQEFEKQKSISNFGRDRNIAMFEALAADRNFIDKIGDAFFNWLDALTTEYYLWKNRRML